MQDKRGQFYIIAAVIIISVIVSLITIKNYAKTPETRTKIYDLSKELKLETGHVSDYGIYNQKNTDELIENWSSIYYDYSAEGNAIEDWVFVYGNEENMTALTFSLTTIGTVGIVSGAGNIDVNIVKGVKNSTNIGVVGEEINVTFKNFTYQFKLKKGENFFFVVRAGGYSAES